jgi:hypothetical protein
MAGNTSRIDVATLRADWNAYVPMGVICQRFTITIHQLVRLRVAWQLPPRNDRSRRYKPSRLERLLDPDASEIAASESSLDLAPMVAERVTVVQATWSPADREERKAVKVPPLRLAPVEVPEEYREMVDDLNQECQW